MVLVGLLARSGYLAAQLQTAALIGCQTIHYPAVIWPVCFSPQNHSSVRVQLSLSNQWATTRNCTQSNCPRRPSCLSQLDTTSPSEQTSEVYISSKLPTLEIWRILFYIFLLFLKSNKVSLTVNHSLSPPFPSPPPFSQEKMWSAAIPLFFPSVTNKHLVMEEQSSSWLSCTVMDKCLSTFHSSKLVSVAPSLGSCFCNINHVCTICVPTSALNWNAF